LLLIFSTIVLSIYLIKTLVYKRTKKRLTVLKNKNYIISRVTLKLLKNNISLKILKNISIKLCMLNSYSYEKNLENAVMLCIIFTVLFFLSILVFVPTISVVWYVSFTYLLMAGAFIGILFVIFTFIARLRFTAKLPETYKLLNSRYMTIGNILKAINISMDDFDKAVRREMYKVHNVLKKNNMNEIDETFRRLESTYKNEYMTLLLNLIMQAHYKGGDEAIKRQFENTTEEILTDIENQKDLSFTARIYMFLGLFLPFAVRWLEKFNQSALGDKAIEFYRSPQGIEIKLIFYFAFFLYLGILLFMERTA
jgi:hypothetical protein